MASFSCLRFFINCPLRLGERAQRKGYRCLWNGFELLDERVANDVEGGPVVGTDGLLGL